MIAGEQPNVLFVIWDACRLDYAKEHAPTLSELGESGIVFENAIAPANWTRPSHASMFTGSYPSEHGTTQAGYENMPTDLVSELNSSGYTTSCVSGNNHLSYLSGFVDSFDEDYYTRHPQSPLGLDAFRTVQKMDSSNSASQLLKLFLASCTHDRSFSSLANVGRLLMHKGAPTKYSRSLEEWKYYTDMCRTERDATTIQHLLQGYEQRDLPFFLFCNDKSTHGPYVPGKDLQRNHIGEALPVDELKRLNNNVGQNWAFEKLVANNAVDEEDLKTVKKLYAGSVEEADKSLKKLIDELKSQELYENTLIIVAADHGESLGEPGVDGRRRFGHGNALNDAVCRVPLVVSHPELKDAVIENPFSLKDIFSLIAGAADGEQQIQYNEIMGLCSEYAVCEFPAAGGAQSTRNKRPDIRDSFINRRCLIDLVAVYGSHHTVVLGSDGTDVRLHNDNVSTNVPDILLEQAKKSLTKLDEVSKKEYDDKTISLLKDMGYI